jgi:hypothetical protein
VFRIAADAVAVNVSVKRGNVPTLGLAAEDFRLFDNNVSERVAAVSMDAVPVDVSFVLDLSMSIAWDVETARDAVRRMATLLRPTDRFRVLTMENSVVNAIPWRLASPAIRRRFSMCRGMSAWWRIASSSHCFTATIRIVVISSLR